MSCKKVYPTLKVYIQHFLSTKIIKYIKISHLNEFNFDSYQFFPLMTFLGEIVEVCLQYGSVLEEDEVNVKDEVN